MSRSHRVTLNATQRKLLAGAFALIGVLLALVWVWSACVVGPGWPFAILISCELGSSRLVVVYDNWVVYHRAGTYATVYDTEIAIWKWGPSILLTAGAGVVGGVCGCAVTGLLHRSR